MSQIHGQTCGGYHIGGWKMFSWIKRAAECCPNNYIRMGSHWWPGASWHGVSDKGWNKIIQKTHTRLHTGQDICSGYYPEQILSVNPTLDGSMWMAIRYQFCLISNLKMVKILTIMSIFLPAPPPAPQSLRYIKKRTSNIHFLGILQFNLSRSQWCVLVTLLLFRICWSGNGVCGRPGGYLCLPRT